jgi:hypothetical protein
MSSAFSGLRSVSNKEPARIRQHEKLRNVRRLSAVRAELHSRSQTSSTVQFTCASSWLHNGDVWCFLCGTNWICICYVEESRPPLWSSGRSSWLHNGDVLCFLWGTNWMYILVCYVEESSPPLWSSGRSSWLQNGDVLCFLWDTNWIYMLCRRKKTATVV